MTLRSLRHPASALAAALVVLLAAAPVLAAPVCVDPERGIGGTGAAQGAIGGTGTIAGTIGGTGSVAGAIGGTGAKASGGIGGTGQMARGVGGTGIVGTITGFASVCVNGLEVHFDGATPVTVNGLPSAADRLAVGQMVAINAGPSPRGLAARRISVLHAVAGPVTEVRADQGLIRVMDQNVRIGPDTRIAGRSGAAGIGDFRPGDLVQVSGHRSGSDVLATRLQEVQVLAEHSIIGRLRPGASGQLRIEETRLEGDARVGDGSEALVRGRWSGRGIVADDVRLEPTRAAIGAVDRVVVEGVVRRDDTVLRVGAFEIDAAGESGRGELQPERRVRISGRMGQDRRVRVDRVEFDRGLDNRGGDRGGGSGGDDASARSGRGGEDQGGADRAEKPDSSGSESGGAAEPLQRVERAEREDRSGKTESVERIDRAQRPEKVERVERPEKVERPETAERPERVQRPEKVERPDRSNSGKSR